MNTSSRHHYLPKFYLQGFTNENGSFAVYDCVKELIETDYRYLKSYFFEWDGNSVDINGKLESFPEDVYKRIDNETAKIFKKIREVKGIPRLSPYEMQGLQFFVSDLFWRNPQNDSHYEQTFKNTRFLKKFLSAIDSNTGELLSKNIPKYILQNEDVLMKSLRPLAGPASFEQSQPDFIHLRISYSSIENFICSDNPFLMANGQAKDIFDSEFLFPLTKNHLLIKSFEPKQVKEFPGYISGFVQLALFLQSKKYCASSTIETLKLLGDVEKNYSVDYLKDRIFGFIHAHDSE